MNYYFDEQLPKSIAEALDKIESHDSVNRIYSTVEAFGSGIQDMELFKKLKEVDGVLVTHDLKMITRRLEYSAINELGITVFLISLPSSVNYETTWRTIFEKWPEIKSVSRKHKRPFVCRIKMRGKPEIL